MKKDSWSQLFKDTKTKDIFLALIVVILEDMSYILDKIARKIFKVSNNIRNKYFK